MNTSISENIDSYRHQTRSRVLRLLRLKSYFGTPDKYQSVERSCTVFSLKLTFLVLCSVLLPSSISPNVVVTLPFYKSPGE